MEGISDLRIIGIDERRPPTIRKEPYIDVIFKLSHKAPADWCNAFSALLANHPGKPKIKAQEGLYIETWVRTPDEIIDLLTLLKDKVAVCTQQYIERIELIARSSGDPNASLASDASAQGRLNTLIAALDFSETNVQ